MSISLGTSHSVESSDHLSSSECNKTYRVLVSVSPDVNGLDGVTVFMESVMDHAYRLGVVCQSGVHDSSP